MFDNAFRRAIRGISLLRQSLKKLEDSFTRVNDEASTLALNIAGLGSGRLLKPLETGTAASARKARQQFGTVSSAIQETDGVLNTFGRGIRRRFVSFAQFTAASQFVIGLRDTIEETIRIILLFDDQLVRLQQITGRTGSAVKGIADEVFRLGAAFGVSQSRSGRQICQSNRFK